MKTTTTERTEKAMLDSNMATIAALHGLGAVDDATVERFARRREKATVKGFDMTTLTPVAEFTPEAVKELREREGASQALMARHLGVAVSTVGQWERGQRKPDGPSAKLLALVQAHGLQYIR